MSDKEARDQIRFLQKIIRGYKKLLEQDLTYEIYMETIDDDIKSSWNDWLEEPEYSPDVYSFRRFIQNNCIDYYIEQLSRYAIKAEALCESSEPTQRFINLAHYDTTLDRKFEKNLAMLIKLQEFIKDSKIA